MIEEKSSRKALRNSTYTLVSYLWPIALTFFITPVIIFSLGIKNYGIYIFVNTIISLFGLLDIGIAAAVTKYLSNYYGKGDYASIKTLLHSANSLFLILGIVGFALSAIIFFSGSSLLPEKFSQYEQYSILFLLGGAMFFVTSSISIYNIIPNALQRFDISSKIGIVSLTISSFSILGIVLFGGGLNEIFLAQLLLAIAFSLVMVYFSKKILPLATYKFGWDKTEIKKCYAFGSVTFLTNVAGSSLTYLDRLIIPFFIGPSNLTYYSVPGNVAVKIPGVSNNLSTVLFPLTSQLEGSQDQAKLETLYVRSFRLITVVSAALTITCISFAHQILFYWLNEDFADKATSILILLAITSFILALSGPLTNFLLGLSKLKFLAIISTSMALFNTLLLVFLLPKYGIVGAAWAYLLSVLPVVYMFYYTEKKYLHLSGRKLYYAKTLGSTLITSLFVWCLNKYFLSLFVVNLPTLLAAGLVSFLSYIIIYRILHFFEEEDWRDIESFFFHLIEKYKIKQ